MLRLLPLRSGISSLLAGTAAATQRHVPANVLGVRGMSFVHLHDYLRIEAEKEGSGNIRAYDLPPPSEQVLAAVRKKKAYIIDMDGVLYWQSEVLPGAVDFIKWLNENKKKYLFLTNSSERSPKELRLKLSRYNIDVPETAFYTSAMATAAFLERQNYWASTAYVIGEPTLTNLIYNAGYIMDDKKPDYVVVGETAHWNYEKVLTAVKCVQAGAKLLGTNCDIADRTSDGYQPACAALMAPIQLTTGAEPYYLGKPNPLIMRMALKKLKVAAEDTAIIGDRMNTDILCGVESEIDTVLLMTGVSTPALVKKYAYQPKFILRGLKDIVPAKAEGSPAAAGLKTWH